MEVLQNVARRYGLACLLHEKPFAGINGSGKHNNWSMATDTGENLLKPGETPHDNVQFLVFCTAVIRAVDKHQELLRATVASAGQRSSPRRERGAAGDHLDLPRRAADRRRRADRERRRGQVDKHGGHARHSASTVLPKLPRDAGDRNRTSPFAFTGNKFEFRAVGSTQSIALAEHGAQHDRRRVARRPRRPAARRRSRRRVARGRAAAGPAEELGGAQADRVRRRRLLGRVAPGGRAQRGLLNLRTTPDALPYFVKPETIAVFEKYEVLNERELRRPLRGLHRAVRGEAQHRGRDGGRDRAHAAAAGGAAPPGAAAARPASPTLDHARRRASSASSSRRSRRSRRSTSTRTRTTSRRPTWAAFMRDNGRSRR